MNTYEQLLESARKKGVAVVDYNFNSSRIKGLYCDNTAAISSKLDTSAEKACILAEELGHYHTSYGNIMDQSSAGNRKQEYHARLWSYNKLIGLTRLIDAFKHGCKTKSDIADYLNVTEEFLLEALQCYKNKYGSYTQLDNFLIYFEPSICILELR